MPRPGNCRIAGWCEPATPPTSSSSTKQRIKPRLPTVEQDLPGGARRLVQKADGIAATIVNGAVAVENGEATGEYAGTVLKGRLAGRLTVCAPPLHREHSLSVIPGEEREPGASARGRARW